jgi:hypothetical protein
LRKKPFFRTQSNFQDIAKLEQHKKTYLLSFKEESRTKPTESGKGEIRYKPLTRSA